MGSLARAGYEDLSAHDCLEVVEFIEKHGDDRAISMRLLEPSFRKVQYARSEGLDWRPLVLTQLRTLGRKEDTSRCIDTKANELRLLHEAAARFPGSVGDQQNFWSRATGKSRASFFRLLARERRR
jgi:hypothetical protein